MKRSITLIAMNLLDSLYRFAQLLAMVGDKPDRNAWRIVVGMFADDPDMAKLHQETRRIREANRAATRDTGQDAL